MSFIAPVETKDHPDRGWSRYAATAHRNGVLNRETFAYQKQSFTVKGCGEGG
ncbi:MAG: hypothetical protein SWH78_07350 [Thermodesulfobacteriota bacterium]|nr:hypothetical protein [Thermodesulfobacteriota bacterium]